MRYPLDELLDKTSIIQLKFERLEYLEDRNRWANEIKEYSIAIGEYIGKGICTKEQVEYWFKQLYEINGQIWGLEADVRKGRLEGLDFDKLEEFEVTKLNSLSKDEISLLAGVGLRAVKIRYTNGKRVKIKSNIVEEIGLGYKDIKINHASE